MRFLKQGKCCFIVEREFVHDVGGRSGVRVETEFFGERFEFAECFQDADGVLDDGEVLESEEVHLEESDLLDITRLGGGGILRHDTFFGTGDVLYRGIFSDRIFGDDDATGMHGGVPGEAFYLFGNVDKAFGIGVAIVERFEIRCLLKRFFH